MRSYTVTRSNVTPNTANDLITIIASTSSGSKGMKIKRIRASGEATTSTAMRTLITRSSGGSTGGGAITPRPTNCSVAAGATFNTTWTSQPELEPLGPIYAESWNAFGGGFDLTLDGREIYLTDGEQLSIRNTVGTGTMSIEVEFEEF